MDNTSKKRIDNIESDVFNLKKQSAPRWIVYIGVIFSIVSLFVAGISAYSAWSINQKTPDFVSSDIKFLDTKKEVLPLNNTFFNVSFLLNNSGKKAGQDITVQLDIDKNFSIINTDYYFDNENSLFNLFSYKKIVDNTIIYRFDSIACNNVSLYFIAKRNMPVEVSFIDDIVDSGIVWESNIIKDYLIEK